MAARTETIPEIRLDLVPPDVAAAVELASALADRSRATIVRMLADGPHCVCELAAALGERQNNVSNHLARLRELGLVRRSPFDGDSRRVYYERDEATCAMALETLRTLFEPAR